MLLILISCGIRPSIELPVSNVESVSGKWIITSNTIVRPVNKGDVNMYGYGSLLSLFGPKCWSQSNGKLFILQEDGQVQTNISDSVQIKEIDLRYEILNDSTMQFTSMSFNDTIRNIMPVQYDISSNKMTWLIDSLLEIELQK